MQIPERLIELDVAKESLFSDVHESIAPANVVSLDVEQKKGALEFFQPPPH